MSNVKPPEAAKITVSYDQFLVSSYIYWIETNGYKPHVLVDMKYPGVKAPPNLMAKDVVPFNMAGNAIVKTRWENDRVEFNARFGGQDFRVIIPYHAMLAVQFAHTSTGMALPWHVRAMASEVESTAVPETLVGETIDQTSASPAPEPEPTPPTSSGGNVVQGQFGKKK